MIRDFEDILQAYMDSKDLTQNALARKLMVSNSQLSNWLSGKSFPTRQNLEKIEALLTDSADFEYLETNKSFYAPCLYRASVSDRNYVFIPEPYLCYDFYSQVKRSCHCCGFYGPQFSESHKPSREARDIAEREGLFVVSLSDIFFDNASEEERVMSRQLEYAINNDGALEDRIKNIFSTVPPSDKFIARNNITTILTTKRADYNVKKVIYI